jgi:hypothetical protein
MWSFTNKCFIVVVVKAVLGLADDDDCSSTEDIIVWKNKIYDKKKTTETHSFEKKLRNERDKKLLSLWLVIFTFGNQSKFCLTISLYKKKEVAITRIC